MDNRVHRSLDTEYPSVITAYNIRDSKQQDKTTSKRRSPSEVATRYTIYALLPVLLPIFIPLAATYIGVQSIILRIRVARLLRDNRPVMDLTRDEDVSEEEQDESIMHEIQDNVNDTLLVGTLDAANIGNNKAQETKGP